MNDLFQRFGQRFQAIVLACIMAIVCASCSDIESTANNPWEVITLPTEATFADIAFTDDPNHGWLVGSRGSMYETLDGGTTWEARPLDLGDEMVSLSSVSFSGDEGWVVGEPSVLLHTKDGGKTWFRIPLSKKLPGAPASIVALGQNSAEMTTNVGAIYVTENEGKNWKALVQDALGVYRNIERDAQGRYVAVSAQGNFYSLWNPGTAEWQPFNRQSSRRVQNMGFRPDGSLWVLARGGQLQFSNADSLDSWQEPISPERVNSWGLLDLSYRTPEEVWVVGGSGTLLLSEDGGTTWKKDREVENVPSNFNVIRFFDRDRGFILGQRGTLLRYTETASATAA